MDYKKTNNEVPQEMDMAPVEKSPDAVHEKQGLVLVNTGNGKGKTTAAMGLMFRAWGHGQKVIMVQFIKNTKANFGEHRAARNVGIEIVTGGAGFAQPGITDNIEESEKLAQEQWEKARQIIGSGEYDLVVLDELSYPLNFEWLNIDEVVEAIKNRPVAMNVVITGRNMPEKIIDIADTVTELVDVKHHFRQGIKARPGIEF